jgi:hypothetical protein
LDFNSYLGSGNNSQSRFNQQAANNTYEMQVQQQQLAGSITRVDKNQSKEGGYQTNKSSTTAIQHVNHHQSNKSLSSSKRKADLTPNNVDSRYD